MKVSLSSHIFITQYGYQFLLQNIDFTTTKIHICVRITNVLMQNRPIVVTRNCLILRHALFFISKCLGFPIRKQLDIRIALPITAQFYFP